MVARIKMIGLTFGRLSVIADSGRRRGGDVIWECVCSCGKNRSVAGWDIRSGHTQSCGCIRSETHPQFLERFWSNVNKSGPTMPHMESPCWVWDGSRKPFGYGQITVCENGVQRVLLAHRIGFELAGGVLTENLSHVCHRCDNPPCVRADHLFAGSQRMNVYDMIKKGRSVSGESHPGSRLTSAQAESIRTIKKHGFGTNQEIAEMFGVGRGTVTDVLKNRTWKKC